MKPKISVITPTIRPEKLHITEKYLAEQSFRDFEWIIEENTSGKSDLNAAFNRAIRKAQGELIVFLQDCIEITPNGLQKFWDAYQESPDTLFTAPVAKEYVWDWRKFRDRTCNWQEWEIDWGACAKSILYDVGGFDEALDEFWGFDNVNLGLRAELKGYKFANLKDNIAWAEDHDKKSEHPFRHLRNPMFHNRRLDEIRMGLEVKYL